MKIEESAVTLSATHEAKSSRSVSAETQIGFRRLFDGLTENPDERADALRQRIQRLLESLIASIMAAIDGRPGPEKLAVGSEGLPATGPAGEATPTSAGGMREIHWQSTFTETVCESEATRFCGQGTVHTGDGRQIAFDFSLSMTRQYRRESVLREEGSVRLQDPLVLNFDGAYCELSRERMQFDLDGNGTAEWIPRLGGASCFLMLDRNGNGRADDGSELFGALSGDGFADLARLDDDGNGWIDEADTAFSRLALWSGEQISTLAERGIGALYTGSVDAPFALKDDDNALLGQIRAAGVYLRESGEVGSLQQVDLAVSETAGRAEEPEQGAKLQA